MDSWKVGIVNYLYLSHDGQAINIGLMEGRKKFLIRTVSYLSAEANYHLHNHNFSSKTVMKIEQKKIWNGHTNSGPTRLFTIYEKKHRILIKLTIC